MIEGHHFQSSTAPRRNALSMVSNAIEAGGQRGECGNLFRGSALRITCAAIDLQRDRLELESRTSVPRCRRATRSQRPCRAPSLPAAILLDDPFAQAINRK